VVAEHRDHFLRLAQPHQPVVHEDAGQLVADGLVDQHGGDRRIDPARQPADHPAVAHLVADLPDRLVLVGAHRPVALEARDPDEVLVESCAVRRVVHLGVELDGIEVARHVGRDREGRVGRDAEHLEPRREARHVVAVAHPHLLALGREPAVEKVEPAPRGRHPCAPELGRAAAARDLAAFDEPAQVLHHRLLAIADAKDRHAQRIGRLGRARGACPRHAVGPAREDDGLRRELRKERVRHLLVGMDLAVDVQLPQAPRDQLRHLEPKSMMRRRSCAALVMCGD
jgi:hypothetical protein